MSSESPVEEQRGRHRRGDGVAVIGRAPRVEMHVLHHHAVAVGDGGPAAEVVGEHIVEVFVPTLVDMHGNDLAFGVDIVEAPGGGGREVTIHVTIGLLFKLLNYSFLFFFCPCSL